MQDDPSVRRLKLRELRVLLAVAEAGSMAKAAAQLAISQPAVSRAIADMEASLGLSLLDRSSKGIEPTPYGRALIKRCVAVFDELRQGVDELKFIADPTVGEVRVGGSAAMATGIIAAVIDRLTRERPGIRFHVLSPEPDFLYRELRERNVDIIFVGGAASDSEEDMDIETLYEDRMVVVAAITNPWSRRRRVRLDELLHEQWALPLPDDASWGTAVFEAFRSNGLEAPKATVTTTSAPLRHTLLATGRFLTVTQESQLHFPLRHPSLKVLPVDLSSTRRPTRIMTLKNRTISPVARLFMECARELAKPIGRRRR